MKYGKFKKLLNDASCSAYAAVFGTENGPDISVFPSPDGNTHVNIRTGDIHVSALQLDHFINEMRHVRKEDVPNDMDIYTIIFVVVHELLHVKYKNKCLSEEEINKKSYETVRAADVIPEDAINTLKLVF